MFWTDADSFITNPVIRLDEFVDDSAELVISRDQNGVNTGEFLARGGSPRVRRFLAEVYQQTRFVNHPLWDQAAVNHVLEEGSIPLTTRYVPKRSINAELVDYVDGDFIIHFLGQPARVYLMRQFLRRAGTSPALPALPAAGSEPGVAPIAPRSAARLRDALQHHRLGRAREAKAICESELAQHPDNAAAVHLLGLIRYESGQVDIGLDLLCRSVELAPSTADFRQNLGGILGKCGRPEEALSELRIAAELRPDSPQVYFNLGVVLRQLKRPAEAVEALRAAVRLRPTYAEAQRVLAEVLADPNGAAASLPVAPPSRY